MKTKIIILLSCFLGISLYAQPTPTSGTITKNVVKNEKGQEIQLDYLQDGQVRTAKFEYDAQGNRIKSEVFNNSGEKIFDSYDRNEGNDLMITQQWFKNNTVDTKLEYVINQSGKLSVIRDYYADTNSYLYVGYSYSGDVITATDSYFVIAGKKTSIQEIGEMISSF